MSTCEAGNEYDGRMGTRISSIFVILFGSFLGTWFPVFAARRKGMGVPAWAFFVAKYFGSGVIVTTAFIHVRGCIRGDGVRVLCADRWLAPRPGERSAGECVPGGKRHWKLSVARRDRADGHFRIVLRGGEQYD